MTSASCDLSILIINWNTLEMLRDVLRSTFDNLDALDAEVIVVDNASSDGSADMVAAEFPQAVLVRNTENTGFAAANNQAMDLARGRYFLLLNSDTIVHGDVLARSLAYMEDHADVGAMGCRVLNTDGSVQYTCSSFPGILNLLLLTSGLWKLPGPKFFDRYQMTYWKRDDERPVDVVSGCYLLTRRDVVDAVGQLDEAFFFFGEETDWCKRMRDAGWKLMFAPVGEITHHGGGSVRKLNHKRDVMLTEATVRLHRKHNGWPGAAAAWTILAGFNFSRAVYWSARSLISPAARERARHFRRIVTASPTTWVGKSL